MLYHSYHSLSFIPDLPIIIKKAFTGNLKKQSVRRIKKKKRDFITGLVNLCLSKTCLSL